MLMRSRSMSNAKAEASFRSKHQLQPQKSKSTHDFNSDSDNSNEYENTEDKTDGEFTLKAKRITKRTYNKVKTQERFRLPELSPIFFRGLRLFVKLHQMPQKRADDFCNEEMVKLALERNGSIIVDNPTYSDCIITDGIMVKSPGFQSYNNIRRVLIDQISWIKNFMPLQNNDSANVSFSCDIQSNSISTNSNIDFSPKSSIKLSNRSVLSSPMAKNDNTCPNLLQTAPKAKKASGIKISSPIRHVILPSNVTSPSATTIQQIAMESTVSPSTNISCTPNSSLNNIMNTKSSNMSISSHDSIPIQRRIQKTSSRNLSDSYRKIQCLPIASRSPKAPMIVVSDYRHLYAPITKIFNSSEQVPQIYLEPAPRYYFMTPFQPIPPNANQIARSCMPDRTNNLQNKVNITQSNFKATNYYCYICRVNFDNPDDHHDSYYHIRNTTPLWEEFDSIAASFNLIEAESEKKS